MAKKFTHEALMAVYETELNWRLPPLPWPEGYKIPLKEQQDAMRGAYASFGINLPRPLPHGGE